jgi:uncharacterized membrane protein HdeD (DUF308 family)
MQKEQANDKSLSSRPAAISIGIGQIVLGIVMAVIAGFAAWLTVKVVGIILIIRGALDIYHARRSMQTKNRSLIFVGIASVAFGAFLLIHSQTAASILILLLAILFIIGGLQKIFAQRTEKRSADRGTAAIGVISLLFGLFILASWPVHSFSILGILLGIEIILNGMSISFAHRPFTRVDPILPIKRLDGIDWILKD